MLNYTIEQKPKATPKETAKPVVPKSTVKKKSVKSTSKGA